MKIKYLNKETNKEISITTDKKFVVVYGKNGTGKTTMSKSNSFDSKYVFNEEFIYKNVFNINNSGFIQSVQTKEKFSELWLGENIINIRKELNSIKQIQIMVDDKYKEIVTKLNSKFANCFSIEFIDKKYNNLLKNKDFTMSKDVFGVNDDTVLKDYYNNYEVTVEGNFVTNIVDEEDFNYKLNSYKKSEIYNSLVNDIKKVDLLDNILFKTNNNALENINSQINHIKLQDEVLKLASSAFEPNVTKAEKEAIGDWYKMHIDRTTCMFCGNDNIEAAKLKWENVFVNTAVQEKRELCSKLKNYISIIKPIIETELYTQIQPLLIEKLRQFSESIAAVNKSIEDGLYNLLENPNIETDLSLLTQNSLLDNLENYLIKMNLKDLEFYFNAKSFLNVAFKECNKKLDEEMDSEGTSISHNINQTLKALGLEKNVEIMIDRRSNPHKFIYNIKNHNSVGELSDGQKHKLALAIFVNSIQNVDLNDKVVVFDDPVVSLDILSYMLFKDMLIRLRTKFPNMKVVLLTHDITYLYIQMSNILENEEIKKDTELYKMNGNELKIIPMEYINVDDISLFKQSIGKINNKNDIFNLNRLIIKVSRILYDLKGRLNGIPDSKDTLSPKIKFNVGVDERIRVCKNKINKTSRKASPDLNAIYESFEALKETADLLGFVGFVEDKDLLRIKQIINGEIDENDSDPIFLVIDIVAEFLMDSSIEKNLKHYVDHTRVSYTRNLIGLSMEDYFASKE